MGEIKGDQLIYFLGKEGQFGYSGDKEKNLDATQLSSLFIRRTVMRTTAITNEKGIFGAWTTFFLIVSFSFR